jgi:hypothetical protein
VFSFCSYLDGFRPCGIRKTIPAATRKLFCTLVSALGNCAHSFGPVSIFQSQIDKVEALRRHFEVYASARYPLNPQSIVSASGP